MSVLVEQQDETINTIEAQADTVQKDVEAGYVYTLHSVEVVLNRGPQAGLYRKGRCICPSCSQKAMDMLLHHSDRPDHCRCCRWCRCCTKCEQEVRSYHRLCGGFLTEYMSR